MEDRCVCCGREIPEGRMVCPTCESIENTCQEKSYNQILEELLRSIKEDAKNTQNVME